MLNTLLEPFSYMYMIKAIIAAGTVGGVCAFLSVYLIQRGWSLIGDALAHSIVPGVAIAYIVNIPFAIGAFVFGFLSSMSMSYIKRITHLKEDAIIGFVFTTFFALGLFIVSISPTPVDVQTIVFGNMIAISNFDLAQVIIIALITFLILLIKWKDLMLVFFDKIQAKSSGLSVYWLNILFFTLLSSCAVASLQTVGAVLVISMLIAPGASAYMLSDRFGRSLLISVLIGSLTSIVGAYLSYFLNGIIGAIIVTIQTLVFILIFIFAPKKGLLAQHRTKKEYTKETVQEGALE